MTKEELLKNPLVEEIAKEFANFYLQEYSGDSAYEMWLSKRPSLLFTTNDNVGIYEKDTDVAIVTEKWECAIESAGTYLSKFKNARAVFDDDEKAHAFIVSNKPCLSLKEISDISYKNENPGSALLYYHLQNYVEREKV